MKNKNGPIDFVVLWVNSNDTEWQKEKCRYRGIAYNDESASDNRFRDWGLFHYMFRAFEQFTPWVNHIYLVTVGHYPEWLNLSHPKLTLVCHDEFIPPEYLPTFSSHTIELNLHRIKGLSENFVYFNDDTFPARQLSEEVFFKNDLPRDAFVQTILTPNANDRIISSVQFNDLAVTSKYHSKKDFLKKNFSLYLAPCYRKYFWRNMLLMGIPKLTGFRSLHSAASFKKSTFEELWQREHDWLNETCLRRFRDMRDINQYVFAQHQIMNGDFVPTDPNKRPYFVIGQDRDRYRRCFERQNADVVCLNDVVEVDFEKEKAFLTDCFDMILPDKSEFEL